MREMLLENSGNAPWTSIGFMVEVVEDKVLYVYNLTLALLCAISSGVMQTKIGVGHKHPVIRRQQA